MSDWLRCGRARAIPSLQYSPGRQGGAPAILRWRGRLGFSRGRIVALTREAGMTFRHWQRLLPRGSSLAASLGTARGVLPPDARAVGRRRRRPPETASAAATGRARSRRTPLPSPHRAAAEPDGRSGLRVRQVGRRHQDGDLQARRRALRVQRLHQRRRHADGPAGQHQRLELRAERRHAAQRRSRLGDGTGAELRRRPRDSAGLHQQGGRGDGARARRTSSASPRRTAAATGSSAGCRATR